VRQLADELRQEYTRRGIQLEEVAGGLLFRTNAAYAPFIREATAKKPVRMTRAQLETLAIVAYRQPLTRPEVDDIRGVDSGPVLKTLLDRDLVRILGKKDEPGRPLLYGTAPSFLEFFGLKSLKDLPSLREFTELSDDSRRTFDREMGAEGDEPTTADVASLAAAASAVSAAHDASSHPTDPSLRTLPDASEPDPQAYDDPTDPDSATAADRSTDPDVAR
jgi:segregation and condensation protein B